MEYSYGITIETGAEYPTMIYGSEQKTLTFCNRNYIVEKHKNCIDANRNFSLLRSSTSHSPPTGTRMPCTCV